MKTFPQVRWAIEWESEKILVQRAILGRPQAVEWREARAAMAQTTLRVETYSGYKVDERPMRFELAGRVFEVQEVEDRWYSPEAVYFRVVASDGNRYVLKHEEARDTWSLEAFRATR